MDSLSEMFNLNELAPNVVQIPASLFQKMLAKLDERKENSKPEKSKDAEPERLFTRKETARMLNVSLVTLSSYDSKGFIKSVRIGRRVLYRASAIQGALKDRRA